jgi:glutamate racemase
MLGIFDSGIGGLTVVKELVRRHPDVSFEYLGDTARAPYGTKGKETIIRYALEDAAFLVDRGATAMIVACNTASAHALPALRERYPAMPIFGVIEPAVRSASASARGRVGVIGTRATIASAVYETELKRIRPGIDVHSMPCPLFVPLVEEGWLDDPVTKDVAHRYLDPLLKKEIDTLILGCTHYPLIADVIAAMMPGVSIVDAPRVLFDGIERDVPQILTSSAAPSRRYWFTDENDRTREVASRWLGEEIPVSRADIGRSLTPSLFSV